MKLRKTMVGVAVCLCLVSTSVFAHTPANARTKLPSQAGSNNSQAIEKEVLALEEVGRQKIVKGDNNWDDLIAAGAYMIGFDGSITIYQKGFQFPPFPVKSVEMSEMIARYYGEAVVVTGLAEVGAETAEKKPFSFKVRFINVWKKSEGVWKIVVSERTGVKPPAK